MDMDELFSQVDEKRKVSMKNSLLLLVEHATVVNCIHSFCHFPYSYYRRTGVCPSMHWAENRETSLIIIHYKTNKQTHTDPIHPHRPGFGNSTHLLHTIIL